MSSAGRKRRRSLRPICYIDMAPFLAIQLVLLFMCMVRRDPDLPRNGADLPKVGHAVPMRAANREDALMVVVQRTGRVWLRYEPVASEQLATRIREAVSRGAERKVYMRADAHAKYGSVREVLAVVRSAGIENVGFLVDQRDKNLLLH